LAFEGATPANRKRGSFLGVLNDADPFPERPHQQSRLNNYLITSYESKTKAPHFKDLALSPPFNDDYTPQQDFRAGNLPRLSF
jgi:hypothetical protein